MNFLLHSKSSFVVLESWNNITFVSFVAILIAQNTSCDYNRDKIIELCKIYNETDVEFFCFVFTFCPFIRRHAFYVTSSPSVVTLSKK